MARVSFQGLAAAVLTLALAANGAAATSAECSTLTQNVLTSDSCPSSCGSYPCVMYSPTQEKKCVELGASGPCLSDEDFTVPGASAACNLTYQCLDSLMNTAGGQWLLGLVSNKQSDDLTTAYVTQIVSLEYPSSVASVQLQGGTTLTLKGEMENIALDQSFFDTPSDTTSMYLIDINLRNTLPEVTLPTTLQYLYLYNVNLNKVPSSLSNLTKLSNLDLSKNYLSEFPEDGSDFVTALGSSLTILGLGENSLTNFSATFPKLTSLNLTSNSFTEIPAVVWDMALNYDLKTLYMTSCNFTNLVLTAEQVTIVEQMTTFTMDVAITDCGTGYETKAIRDGSIQVCYASTTSGDDDDGSSHSTLYIIIGVVVAVAVVLGIIAFVLYRRHRRSTRNDVYIKDDGSTGMGTDGVSTISGDTMGTSTIWNDPDLLAVRIDHRDVEAIKLLSRGGFGEVWLGLYMNENVAIKRLLGDKKNVQDALTFAVEIKTMARLDHPKIVRFIGVSWMNALSIQAITEFMDCGDLKSLLDSPRSTSLTWANLKCQIAIDIADALVYLHTLNPKLIHRDLKSRNVLIDAQTGAKLSDFGISRNRSYEETMTAGVGTARWIAPEVILGGHYTEFADIYSFGVVLSELDTCKPPYHDATNTNGGKMQDVTILQLVSAGKLTPSFTDNCPESIVRLAAACLSFDPAQRPSAIHISYELRKIMKDEL